MLTKINNSSSSLPSSERQRASALESTFWDRPETKRNEKLRRWLPKKFANLNSKKPILRTAGNFETSFDHLMGSAQSHPRCTKRNSPTINAQCTNFILFDGALQLRVPVKGLNGGTQLQ